MDTSHVRSLIATVDELIFAHTGEHLDDLEQGILEGTIDHQKYAEIAQNNHRSEKYVKDVASKLWQSLSAALGEEVNKSNIKSSLQRYYYSNFSALLGFVDKLYSRIQFLRKKPSDQEKKPQRHKGHKEKAKLMS
jgi:hypothetical protein